MDITIIGAAILDVLAQPVDREVFETGSWPVEDLQMNMAGTGPMRRWCWQALGNGYSFRRYWALIWRGG